MIDNNENFNLSEAATPVTEKTNKVEFIAFTDLFESLVGETFKRFELISRIVRTTPFLGKPLCSRLFTWRAFDANDRIYNIQLVSGILYVGGGTEREYDATLLKKDKPVGIFEDWKNLELDGVLKMMKWKLLEPYYELV